MFIFIIIFIACILCYHRIIERTQTQLTRNRLNFGSSILPQTTGTCVLVWLSSKSYIILINITAHKTALYWFLFNLFSIFYFLFLLADGMQKTFPPLEEALNPVLWATKTLPCLICWLHLMTFSLLPATLNSDWSPKCVTFFFSALLLLFFIFFILFYFLFSWLASLRALYFMYVLWCFCCS